LNVWNADNEKIVNALKLAYSNAKLEVTNNLIKLIKRNAFGFRNFKNFKKNDEICPFSRLAFHQPTTVDKEPKNVSPLITRDRLLLHNKKRGLNLLTKLLRQ
ncbi:transposase, partial [Streptococcus sp. 10824]|uniref:transposase n=1 Tax=Streptococcus sp. 10824 TaxID=2582678 RepID=UPI001F0397D2